MCRLQWLWLCLFVVVQLLDVDERGDMVSSLASPMRLASMKSSAVANCPLLPRCTASVKCRVAWPSAHSSRQPMSSWRTSEGIDVVMAGAISSFLSERATGDEWLMVGVVSR